jgi:tRNA dimethylallyltransferase
LNTPLIVIGGETGSGKTTLAIILAQKFKGEIISADSRTVYKGMDIGTAKPTLAERQGVPHYGFDLVHPDQPFSVYDFQQFAQKKISDIVARGKLPIMVGGTGLYVDAVIYDYVFRPLPDMTRRAELQALTVDELQRLVLEAGLLLPENSRNSRHLTRLLESGISPLQQRQVRSRTLILGLQVPQSDREQRIRIRVQDMIRHGFIDEVRRLYERYPNSEALRAPGYKAFGAYIRGEIDQEEAKRQVVLDHLRLAKRQRTWFRRNSEISWLSYIDRQSQAILLVQSFLEG